MLKSLIKKQYKGKIDVKNQITAHISGIADSAHAHIIYQRVKTYQGGG